MNQSNRRVIVLGPEYDKNTRNALQSILAELGATLNTAQWNVGGSQEIESITAILCGQEIIVEAETFIGLTITGEVELVTSVAKLVAERLEGEKGASP
jgi:hypothetical protein